MFQFRRLPSYTYVFSIWYTSYTCMDCSIRKSTDQSVLTAPRSLSQLITSFFGSQCQGIRPALFLALPFVSCSEFSWLLINILCSFYPTITFKLSFYTRSILICITFALFCFQVAFCSFWEQISIINSSWLLKYAFKKIIFQFLLCSGSISTLLFAFCEVLFSFVYFSFSAKRKVNGGHKWTRTIDLTLIRRAL